MDDETSLRAHPDIALPTPDRVEWIEGAHGHRQRSALFPAIDPVGTVVLSTGRTEFIEKYAEVPKFVTNLLFACFPTKSRIRVETIRPSVSALGAVKTIGIPTASRAVSNSAACISTMPSANVAGWNVTSRGDGSKGIPISPSISAVDNAGTVRILSSPGSPETVTLQGSSPICITRRRYASNDTK